MAEGSENEASTSVAVLAGGVGAAKLLTGMVRAVPPESITAIVNVADDVELHGLHISPDLDTVVYTLADAIDAERGWGLKEESWQAMDGLDRYGADTWFRLGDKDLATHMFRTQRKREGAPLSRITAEIAKAWDLKLNIVPATDDRLRTMITLMPDNNGGEPDIDPLQPRPGPRVVSFQEYFVQRRHAVPIAAVRFDGELDAQPAPGVMDALESADRIVIAPSNPVVSIGPVLAVAGVRDALRARRDDTVAISPIVGGQALKGPADRMLTELGHEASVVGVANLYSSVAGTLVIDEADADLASGVEEAGMRCVVTNTIMRDAEAAEALCQVALDAKTE